MIRESFPDCFTIAQLTNRIDAAFDTPSQFSRLLREALSTAAQDERLLTAEQREGGIEGYARHLLAADPRGRYAVAALVWSPGQSSPVHAHRTWCGYAVIEGTLTETLYRWNPADNRAYAVREEAREAGAVSFAGAGRGAIHQLGNATDAGRRAISLHVYGVAGAQLATHVNDLVAV